MEMDEGNILMKAVIDCPLCCTDNAFDFKEKNRSVDCEDCGFNLVKKEPLLIDEVENIKNCVFCNYDKFYYGTSWLGLFKSNTINCYLCEAEYYDWQFMAVDTSFNSNNEEIAKKSEQALEWKNRISSY